MKLSKQLLIAPLLTAVVAVLAVAVFAFVEHRQSGAARVADAAGLEAARTVGQAQTQLTQVRATVFRLLTLLDSMKDDEVKQARAELQRQVDGVARNLERVAAADAELAALGAQIKPLLATYGKQTDKAIDLSGMDANVGVGAMRAADDTFAQAAKGLEGMAARLEALRIARGQADARRMALLSAVLVGLSLLAAAAAMAFAWRMQRRIVGELAGAVQLSRDVAQGRLQPQAGSQRSDEIGDLLRALGEMVQRLRGSLLTVRQATDSIGTASREIAQGNADLSQRTEQAAGSLQQTASSTEQLTATVRQTADSARTASQLAASASEVAARGGSVVSQVVATMDEINTSSHRIADIIGTIDGIAFQTNILALNAAVEAARAGEQGRGFAVVASEVRGLAQRSAQAAREIKSLIGASVERVEAGTRLVGDAGSTMTEIVASVQRVADIIGEISAAAAEQSGGLAQVNGAVGSLDQMTQQNAALVEQSAAAAESLREQAARLTEVLSGFELGDAGAAPAVAPEAPARVAQAVLQRAAAPAPAPQKPRPQPRPTAAGPAAEPAPARAQPASTAAAGDAWETF